MKRFTTGAARWLCSLPQRIRLPRRERRAFDLRLTDSRTGEESELARTCARLRSSKRLFGVLTITTKALRFESRDRAADQAAPSSLEIPLPVIRSVTVSGHGFIGGSVILITDWGLWSFTFPTAGRARRIKELIIAACTGPRL